MRRAINQADYQRKEVENNIFELSNRKSSLSLFKIKEKNDIQSSIEELYGRLNDMVSGQQVELKYQNMIDGILAKKTQVIEKTLLEIRPVQISKYKNELSSQKQVMEGAALHSIMKLTAEGEHEARRIYALLYYMDIISSFRYRTYVGDIPAIKRISKILDDKKMYSKDELTVMCKIYPSFKVERIILMLAEHKCIEKYNGIYCKSKVAEE